LGERAKDGAAAPSAAPEPGRSLVVVTEPGDLPEGHSTHRHRPQAAFLAHLIAMREQVPQVRQRRRVELRTAISRYAATASTGPQPFETHLIRSA
jgi:hypothetical protein